MMNRRNGLQNRDMNRSPRKSQGKIGNGHAHAHYQQVVKENRIFQEEEFEVDDYVAVDSATDISSASKMAGYGPYGATQYCDEEIMEDFDDDEIIVEEGRELLGELIINEVRKDNNPEVERRVRQQVELATSSGRVRRVVVTHSHVRNEQIVVALATIGDALEADHSLNRLIENVPATWETFQDVAQKLFADGINWGRIVTLFVFACKLVRRSLDNIPMISLILDWATKIIRMYFAHWIVAKGGWKTVIEWFGPSWSKIGMTFGAVIFAYCAACKIRAA